MCKQVGDTISYAHVFDTGVISPQRRTAQNIIRLVIEIPLLFIDTESDPKTKEPICVQTGYTGHFETVKDFKHSERLSHSGMKRKPSYFIMLLMIWGCYRLFTTRMNGMVLFGKCRFSAGKIQSAEDTRTQEHS